MAVQGLRERTDGFSDADFCGAPVGMQSSWSGTYTVSCRTCGIAVRTTTDAVTGDTYVLYRAGVRWYEWAGAPSFVDIVEGRERHPRGDRLARRERGIREAVAEDRLAGGVRDEVREQG